MLIPFLNRLLLFLNWNYEVTSLIVESGQRIVFKGTDGTVDVVVKISKYSDPNSIARCEREIKILKELQNSGFPEIRDHVYCSKEIISYFRDALVDEKNTELITFMAMNRIDSFYLSVESYIEHQDWSSAMQSIKASEQNYRKFFYDCFELLELVWQKGFAHRDIKPENILIGTNDNLSPHIIDFGIAKSMHEGTANLTIGHTPHTFQYASPEQIFNNSDEINFKSDQFSLGVIMYLSLTNEFPYGPSNHPDFKRRLRDGELKHLDSFNSLNISPEIKNLIHKLLATQPHDRFRKPETILKILHGE